MSLKNFLIIALSFTCFAFAQAKTYTFSDPKGVNAVSIFIDSPLEPIFGFGKDLSGTVSFDPAAPEKTKGKIDIPVSGIVLSSAMMTKYMLGASWLDGKGHTKVSFEFDKVSDVKSKGNKVQLTANGKLLIKGKSLEKSVIIEIELIKDGAKKRGKAPTGDLLVLRSKFDFSRSVYNIKPGQNFDKVGDKIEIHVAIAGYEQR